MPSNANGRCAESYAVERYVRLWPTVPIQIAGPADRLEFDPYLPLAKDCFAEGQRRLSVLTAARTIGPIGITATGFT
jgi:hypothetical protein